VVQIPLEHTEGDNMFSIGFNYEQEHMKKIESVRRVFDYSGSYEAELHIKHHNVIDNIVSSLKASLPTYNEPMTRLLVDDDSLTLETNDRDYFTSDYSEDTLKQS